jgi:glycosyltransferase involved in cell wall biosynthesis
MTSVHPSNDGRIFYKECLSLKKANYEVFFVALNAKTEIRDGVNIIGVKEASNNRFIRIFKGARQVYKKSLSLNASIYHFHDPELLIYGLLLHLKGKKVIYDCHEDVPADIISKKYLPKVVSFLFYLIYKLLEFVCVSKIDAVITVSPHIVRKLKKINHHVVQITNYPIVDNSRLTNLDSNIKLSKPTIFFAGGVNALWMHENIILAIERLNREIQYIIAGPASQPYIGKLEHLNAWSKVKYLGVIKHSEVEYYYNVSHIGIALMDYSKNVGWTEGTLGNTKLFEIMLSGLPIICTDFSLWKDIVLKSNSGICVNPRKVEDIANAIDYLLNNAKNGRVMGINGRDAVLKCYTWETQESILLNLYKTLL